MLVRSNMNDALDRAEDPEKAIKQLLMDMNNQMIQVKTQVAAAIADEKRLRSTYEDAQRRRTSGSARPSLRWTGARTSWRRRRSSGASTTPTRRPAWRSSGRRRAPRSRCSRTGCASSEAKMDEAEAKKELLIARHRSAKAQEQMHKTLSSVQGMGSLSEFDRLERKVKQQEARAQAYTELSTDTLDSKFEALESESEVDQQLRELKAAPPAGPAPAGPTVAPEVGSPRPWTEVHGYLRAVATRLRDGNIRASRRDAAKVDVGLGLRPAACSVMPPARVRLEPRRGGFGLRPAVVRSCAREPVPYVRRAWRGSGAPSSGSA